MESKEAKEFAAEDRLCITLNQPKLPSGPIHPDIRYESLESATVRDNQPSTFSSPVYVAFVHSAERFVRFETAGPGTINLLNFAKKHRISRVGFVQNDSGPEYNFQFYPAADMDLLVESTAGQHNIYFPNTNTLIVAGGNLTQCLCAFLRDTIRNANRNLYQPLRIILVSDAIYDKGLLGIVDSRFRNLQEFVQAEGTKPLLELMRKYIFGTGPQHICWNHYTGPGYSNIFRHNYVFRIFSETKELAVEGQESGIPIDFFIVPSNRLESLVAPSKPQPGREKLSSAADIVPAY